MSSLRDVYDKLTNPNAGYVNSDGSVIDATVNQFLDNVAMVGPFGQQIVGELVSNVSANWADGKLMEGFRIKAPVTTGDGSVDASLGLLRAESNTGTANVETRPSLRYSNGRGFFASWTTAFIGSSGEGWGGPFDADSLHDGFPIRFNKDTGAFDFLYLREGTPTNATSIPYQQLGIDPSKMNIYMVLGGFLGVANPILLIRKDKWVVGAVINTEGVMEGTHTRLPAFPIGLRVSGGLEGRIGSCHAGTIGEPGKVQDIGTVYPNEPFSDPGGDNPVATPSGTFTLSGTNVATAFVIRSKETINSLPNKVKADVIQVKIEVKPSTNNGTLQAQLIGNPNIAYDDNDFDDMSPFSVLDIDANPGAQATTQYIPGTSGGDVVGEPFDIPYTGSGGRAGSGSGVSLVDELSLDGIAGESLALILRDLDGNNITVHWSITLVERQV